MKKKIADGISKGTDKDFRKGITVNAKKFPINYQKNFHRRCSKNTKKLPKKFLKELPKKTSTEIFSRIYEEIAVGSLTEYIPKEFQQERNY